MRLRKSILSLRAGPAAAGATGPIPHRRCIAIAVPRTNLASLDAAEDDIAALRRMGLVGPDECPRLTPLAGGVSSDIRLVEVDGRRFCFKRALARLKVAAIWEAPVSRNAAEVDWMRHVNSWLPGAAPAVLGEDRSAGLFAMAYLDPARHPVWKAQLMAGRADADFAAAVGRDLATIHAWSARDPALPGRFACCGSFDDLRLDPYLRATARAHPRLADRLQALAARTRATETALMHGDVSPKNILVGPDGPVFLDAECACFGDPAFDLAFCLNHLLLKGARAGVERDVYAPSFAALAEAYLSGVDWEPASGLEGRAAALLPALMLARIDGKSPVEYLAESEQGAVRAFSLPFIERPPERLAALLAGWTHA